MQRDVVTRKLSGGNRTRRDAGTQQVLASVVRTARQRDLVLPLLIVTMLRPPTRSCLRDSDSHRRPPEAGDTGHGEACRTATDPGSDCHVHG